MEYIAFLILLFVIVMVFYTIIIIHDVPYEIAKRRNHPHCDAIHVAGWISLFTLHAIWPFLWIWATLYREDRGWGFADAQAVGKHISELEAQIERLKEKVALLETNIAVISDDAKNPSNEGRNA